MVGQWAGAKGNTCWKNADSSFILKSVFSRVSTAVGVDLTTYGMVGSQWSHDRGCSQTSRRTICGCNEYFALGLHIILRSYGPIDYRTCRKVAGGKRSRGRTSKPQI